MGMALELKCTIESNLIRVNYHCVSCYFHFNFPFKQLYKSKRWSTIVIKVGMVGICMLIRRAGLGYR